MEVPLSQYSAKQHNELPSDLKAESSRIKDGSSPATRGNGPLQISTVVPVDEKKTINHFSGQSINPTVDSAALNSTASSTQQQTATSCELVTPFTHNSATVTSSIGLGFLKTLGKRTSVKSSESIPTPTPQPLLRVSDVRDRVATAHSTQSEMRANESATLPNAMGSEHLQKKLKKRFPELASHSVCVSTYVCTLDKESGWHGSLYVLNTHVCFYGKFFTKSYRVVIPLEDVVLVERKSTAKVFQNALKITTRQFSYLFTNFLRRDAAYRDVTHCVHLAKLRPYSHLAELVDSQNVEDRSTSAVSDSLIFTPALLKKSVSLPNANMAMLQPPSPPHRAELPLYSHQNQRTTVDSQVAAKKATAPAAVDTLRSHNVSGVNNVGIFELINRIAARTSSSAEQSSDTQGLAPSTALEMGSTPYASEDNSVGHSLSAASAAASIPHGTMDESGLNVSPEQQQKVRASYVELLEQLRAQFPIEAANLCSPLDPFLTFMYLQSANSPLIASLHDFYGGHSLEATDWSLIGNSEPILEIQADMVNEIRFTHVCQLPVSHKVASTTCDMVQKVRIARPDCYLAESRIAFKNIPLSDQFRAVGVHFVTSAPQTGERTLCTAFVGFKIEFLSAARFGQHLVQKLATDALLTLYKETCFLFEAFAMDKIAQQDYQMMMALEMPSWSPSGFQPVETAYHASLTDRDFLPTEKLTKITSPMKKRDDFDNLSKTAAKKSGKTGGVRKKGSFDSLGSPVGSGVTGKLHHMGYFREKLEAHRKLASGQRRKVGSICEASKLLNLQKTTKDRPAKAISIDGEHFKNFASRIVRFVSTPKRFLLLSTAVVALLTFVIIYPSYDYIYSEVWQDLRAGPSAKIEASLAEFLALGKETKDSVNSHLQWISRASGLQVQVPCDSESISQKIPNAYDDSLVRFNTRIQGRLEQWQSGMKLLGDSFQQSARDTESICMMFNSEKGS